MNQKHYIGIDMGGTFLKGGLVSSNGKVLKLGSVKVNPRMTKQKVVDSTIRLIEDFGASGSFAGIGLGWPAEEVNIPPVKGILVKQALKKKFKLPVQLENDGSCFALSEALIGSGKAASIVLGMTLGTGLGYGLIINKKIFKGKGRAPEFGHLPLDYNGPKCNCGNWGCLETYIGKKGITRLAKKHGATKSSGADLCLLAQKGNRKAIKVWEEYGKLLGIGMVNIFNAFDPEIVIVGGKVSRAWRYFNKSMKQEINRRSFVKPCPIKLSRLENSGIIGAALLVK